MSIPGFIDLQVNGYKGLEFSDANLDECKCADVCRALLENGTAGFLPTVITSDDKTYKRSFAVLADIIQSRQFKHKVLGIHAEGPFISKITGAVGAHNQSLAKNPSIKYFEKMQKWAKGHIKMVTIAAELKGAVEFTKEMVKQHITVSVGHQLAGYDQLKKLADAGAKAITHLGNGMPNMVNRHNNPLIAGLAESRLTAMIITDGHHLPEQTIMAVVNAKKPDKLIITSDASPIAGLKPGKYDVLGNKVILEKNGLLHNPEKNCLVGSSFTMIECMNYMLSLNLFDEERLFMAGFYNPLKMIGISPKDIKSKNSVKLDKTLNKFIIKKG